MAKASHQKRGMQLLERLAEKENQRHDVLVSLAEVAPSLDFKAYARGQTFVDRETPVYRGGSDLAYDFNTLQEKGFNRKEHMKYEKRNSFNESIPEAPAILVTAEGPSIGCILAQHQP